VTYRDVTQLAIPVVTAAWDRANRIPKLSRTKEQNNLLAFSTELTRELLEADEYVFGIPMHNLGPSASFKLWLDHIVRFGETVLLTPSGPKGALGKKKATFIVSVGGIMRPGSPFAYRNYLEPWLCTMFGYLGLRDMHFILADGTAKVKNGKLDQEAFLAPHIESINDLFLYDVLQ
jgi:FMN-dependent NADH-azoreductase